MPVCIHINLISRASPAAEPQGGAGRRTPSTAERQSRRPGPRPRSGLAGVFSMVPSTIGQLIFTGVFERFPGLHVSMIETGVGWLPHFLEQMDDRYWRNRSWGDMPITEPPSYYWYRNMSATFITRPGRAAQPPRRRRRQHDVVDRLPAPRQRLAVLPQGDRRDDGPTCPQDERDQIFAGNAVRIFGLDSD